MTAEDTADTGNGTGRVVKRLLIGVGVLVAGVLVMMGLTPKPMSSDLSVVGQGTPSIVLAYENFSPMGGEALALLKQVRSDYESRLHFVVADMGTPAGNAFTSRYGLHDGQAVLVAGDGQPIARAALRGSEQALREQLDEVLATRP